MSDFKTVIFLYNRYKLLNENAKDSKIAKVNDIENYFVAIISESIHQNQLKSMSKEEIDNRISESRKLGFWCFNPGLGFCKLNMLKPRSIILASGTLSPLTSLSKELKMDFPVQVE